MRLSTQKITQNKAPLTPAQKKSVLAQIRQKLESPENERAIFEKLFSDVENNNSLGYPPLLADQITKLNGPYQILETTEDRSHYDGVVVSYLKKNATRLFRESSASEEGWGNTQIHLLSEKFTIAFQAAHSVKFTIIKGKLLWQISYAANIVASKHQFPTGIPFVIIEMTLDEFRQFKNAGKRKRSKYPSHFFQQDGASIVLPFYQDSRNPQRGSILDHSNTNDCHICLWDVDEYNLLKLHRRGKHVEDKTNKVDQSRLCCGKDLPFELDHIPAASLLKEMRRIYPGLETLFGNDKGYVIALSKSLHKNFSETYQEKAKQRDVKAEAKNPSAAILTDISAYFNYFHDSKKMTLTILGAFRYLYRKNVKRYDAFWNSQLDDLFLKSIILFLRSREENHKLPVSRNLASQSGALFSIDGSTEFDVPNKEQVTSSLN